MLLEKNVLLIMQNNKIKRQSYGLSFFMSIKICFFCENSCKKAKKLIYLYMYKGGRNLWKKTILKR